MMFDDISERQVVRGKKIYRYLEEEQEFNGPWHSSIKYVDNLLK